VANEAAGVDVDGSGQVQRALAGEDAGDVTAPGYTAEAWAVRFWPIRSVRGAADLSGIDPLPPPPGPIRAPAGAIASQTRRAQAPYPCGQHILSVCSTRELDGGLAISFTR
jgi:hypothetical protein